MTNHAKDIIDNWEEYEEALRTARPGEMIPVAPSVLKQARWMGIPPSPKRTERPGVWRIKG